MKNALIDKTKANFLLFRAKSSKYKAVKAIKNVNIGEKDQKNLNYNIISLTFPF